MKLPANNLPKKTIPRLVRLLKEKSNLFLFTLLTASFLGAGIIFYLYVIKKPDLPATSQNIKINKQLRQEVISRLDARETNIQQGIGQDYWDVFK